MRFARFGVARPALAGAAAICIALMGMALLPSGATAKVLRVGTYKGIRGQYTTIQAAADAARRGDWILIGPSMANPCKGVPANPWCPARKRKGGRRKGGRAWRRYRLPGGSIRRDPRPRSVGAERNPG
jgi:hypothetical protein